MVEKEKMGEKEHKKIKPINNVRTHYMKDFVQSKVVNSHLVPKNGMTIEVNVMK